MVKSKVVVSELDSQELGIGLFNHVPSVVDIDGPLSLVGASSCNSIDQTTDDNGFLNCTRDYVSGELNHGSTQQAVSNLIGCTSTPTIWGHGSPGFIITGTGQIGTDPTKYIAHFNQSTWEKELKKLKGKARILTLMACNPGAESSGVDLLYNLARVIDFPVRAPTGTLFCGNGRIRFEAGSVYQYATPGRKPDPIPAPTPPPKKLITLITPTSKYSIEQVRSGKLVLNPKSNIPDFTLASTLVFDQGEIIDLIRFIDFEQPIVIQGSPASIITAFLEISLEQNDSEIKMRFIIYNDNLVQDFDSPSLFYKTFVSLTPFFRFLL